MRINSKSGLNRRNGGVIYRGTLRLVHAGFGLVALFSFLLTIRRIGVLQLLQGQRHACPGQLFVRCLPAHAGWLAGLSGWTGWLG